MRVFSDPVRRTSRSAAQTWSFHRIRLTSHGVPRIRGAAARPDGLLPRRRRVLRALASRSSGSSCPPSRRGCASPPAWVAPRGPAQRSLSHAWRRCGRCGHGRGAGARARGRRCGEARHRCLAPSQMLRPQRRRRGARRLLRSRTRLPKRFRRFPKNRPRTPMLRHRTLPHPPKSQLVAMEAAVEAGRDKW